jgi:hypothetical protein
MKGAAQAASALLALFPTHQSFRRFTAHSENEKSLESIVAFAARNGLIANPDKEALSHWVNHNTGSTEAPQLPSHLSFEDLFEQKKSLLELNLSARALSDRINALLTTHRIELPKLSNSMLSRLKKEAADTLHKQNVLRSLAFWIGYDRGHLRAQWNFESLLTLCREGKSSTEHRQGVRVGFALYSRGDVIDHDIVGWLKRELKDYIETAIGQFTYGRWGKVRSHGITTLYVDLPKEQESGEPAAYRQCMRSAVCLAHQMSIRWAMSDRFSQNRFLSIGIAAGDFNGLDNYLIPILNAKLPGDPVIRLTDYARQCVLINDIRALLCGQPAEISLLNGEALTIWWVTGFWTTLYFDFIPQLLNDPILGHHEAALERLFTRLWPAVAEAGTGRSGTDAIATFLRFPHNSLLGLEIAKTLFYRRRFWEALEVLKIVLSLDPAQLNARTLRMVLLRNLALDAPTHNLAMGLFRQAHHEAHLIEQNCDYPSEDFFCEYAVVFQAQAMATLRYLRAGHPQMARLRDGRSHDQKVIEWLDQAEALFEVAMIVSPTGIRAIYLLNALRVLRAVLLHDARLFSEAHLVPGGPSWLVHEAALEAQWQLGYLRRDLPAAPPYLLTERIYKFITRLHDDSIALQAYRPTTYFCTAVAWWDLFPERTVGSANLALRLLRESAAMAQEMEQKGVCIYSFTRTYGEMMPVPEFDRHIHRCIQMIETFCGDLNGRDDREVIEPEPDSHRQLLMALNF